MTDNGHVLSPCRRRRPHGHPLPARRAATGLLPTARARPPAAGGISPCNNGAALANCAVTVLDHFTSSFHWAQTNFAAIWLRPQWYLVDQQRADGCPERRPHLHHQRRLFPRRGHRGRLGAGEDQPVRRQYPEAGNAFTSNSGPFLQRLKPDAGLHLRATAPTPTLMACTSSAEGVSFPLSNFGVSQRLFNIYDGPAYQESNIYLDITPTPCEQCMYAAPPRRAKADQRSTPYELLLPAQCGHRLEAAQRLLLSALLPLEQPVLRQCRRSGTTSSMPCSRRTPISRTLAADQEGLLRLQRHLPQLRQLHATSTGRPSSTTMTAPSRGLIRRSRSTASTRTCERYDFGQPGGILQRAGGDGGMPVEHRRHRRTWPAR